MIVWCADPQDNSSHGLVGTPTGKKCDYHARLWGYDKEGKQCEGSAVRLFLGDKLLAMAWPRTST